MWKTTRQSNFKGAVKKKAMLLDQYTLSLLNFSVFYSHKKCLNFPLPVSESQMPERRQPGRRGETVYSAGIVTWLGRLKPLFFTHLFTLHWPLRPISFQVLCRHKSWFVRLIVFHFAGILKITRKAAAWVHQGFSSNWQVNLTKSMPYLKCVDFSITQFHFH